MQLTFVVHVNPSYVYETELVASDIEDMINALHGPRVNSLTVEKVFHTLPGSLVAINPDTAVRVNT